MKLEDWMNPKTMRQYTEECKAEAVRLVRDTARPVEQVAREHGLCVTQLRLTSRSPTCYSRMLG